MPISYPKSSFLLTSGRDTRQVKFFSLYINHASNNGILKVVFVLQMNAFSVNFTQETSHSIVSILEIGRTMKTELKNNAFMLAEQSE